ncbi:MAG: hypothetical protein PHD76_03510 [Methylacidiphilales bacterium]|nr:hypothetical protein [Candidatus Methylacidiphilales bacterium]
MNYKLLTTLCVLAFLAIGNRPADARARPPQPANTDNNSNFTPFNPNYLPVEAGEDGSQQQVSFSNGSPNGLGVDSVDTSKSVVKPAATSSEWFRHPAFFAELEGGGSNDTRVNGIASDRFVFRLGMDFQTVADIVFGIMYNQGDEWGTISETSTHLFTNTHLFTLYAGKNFFDWLNVGATFTTGIANETSKSLTFRNDRDIFTLAPSVYIGVAHSWKEWGFSSTASYIYDEDNLTNNANGTATSDFNQSPGMLSWINKGTYYINDKFDVTGMFKFNQILHTNVVNNVSSGEHNEHHWGTAGVKFNYNPSDKWQISTAFDYVVLSENYDQDWTSTIGATYSY